MSDIRVEDRLGRVFVVSDSGTCTCGTRSCEHRRRFEGVLEPSKNLVYTAKSGLHKELRRGDIARATGWAGIVERAGSGGVHAYLRRVLFEETRNLHLLLEIQGAEVRSWTRLVSLLCRSKKDWELPWDRGWWSPEWVCAAHDTATEDDSYTRVVLSGFGGSDDLVQTLLNKAVDRRPDLEDALKEAARYRANDEVSVIWSVAAGRLQNDAFTYREEPENLRPIDVPWPRNYVYDCHTWRGMERIQAADPPLRFGEPLPRNLDLRWSGAEAGTLWRYLAFRAAGTCDVPWEAVTPHDELRVAHERLVREAWMDWKGIPPEVV